MTLIPFSSGKIVMRDGKVGTGQPCCCGCRCQCSSLDPPFVDESCDLQAVIVDFDLSLYGPCKGAATVQVEAADVDLGFAWSKVQDVETDGGILRIEVNVWCLSNCLAVQFTIYAAVYDGTQCEVCPPSGSARAFDVYLDGENNEMGICCPVGATYRLGPNLPFCYDETVELSLEITCVY
jgi:hypothetical protein